MTLIPNHLTKPLVIAEYLLSEAAKIQWGEKQWNLTGLAREYIDLSIAESKHDLNKIIHEVVLTWEANQQ